MEKNLKTTISGKYYFLALGIFILFSFIFFYFTDFSPFKSFKISDSAFKVDFSSQALKNFHFPRDKLQKPILLLTFQIFLMIFLSRGLVTILKKNGQPAILGEIGAGIVLGPTVLGLIFPNFYRIFFPESSISILSTLSQFGMLIFMFVVGMNLDVDLLKSKFKEAITISHTTIFITFFFSMLISHFFYLEYAPPKIHFLSFLIFFGISFSITAYPVLIRIVQEKGILQTKVGILAINAAAIDGITLWLLLAAVMVFLKSTTIFWAIFKIALLVIFFIFMIKQIQPFLGKMSKVFVTDEIISRNVISLIVFILLLSSIFTELMGISGIFGAFLAGVIMPTDSRLRTTITEKFEEFSSIIFLPLYFTFSGLRMDFTIFQNLTSWKNLLIILLVSYIGKTLGAVLSGRILGYSTRERTALGVLMNTRGIMELVVLNIGYDLGIISGELFTLLVLMGLISTLTSSPLIRILLVKKEKFVTDTNLKKQNLPSVLIAFGPPQSGSTLLLLSYSIFKKSCEYSAIHLSPVSEKITIENTGKNSKEIFKPITKLAEEKLVSLQTIYHHTNNITSEIVSLTNSKDYDYLIIGAAKTLFGDNILGGKVDTIVSQVKSRVGIFLDRGFKQISSLLIYYQNPIESDILFEIGGMIQKDGVQDINLVYEKGNEPSEEKLRKYFSKGIRATSTDKNSKKIMNRFSLILIGYSHWLEISSDQTDKFLSEKEEWPKETNSSILILKSDGDLY